MKRFFKFKGFTLLELIVVLTILGILAALAIPTFASILTKSRSSTVNASAQAFVRDAKAICARNNANSTGIDKTSLEKASLEITAAVPMLLYLVRQLLLSLLETSKLQLMPQLELLL